MKSRVPLTRIVHRTLVHWLLFVAMNLAVASVALAQPSEEPGGNATTAGEQPSMGETSGMPSMPMEEMKMGMGGMGAMPMEEGMKMSCACESAMMRVMQGPLGIAVVVLSVLLLASVVAALGALTVFLVRRSRYPGRGAAA